MNWKKLYLICFLNPIRGFFFCHMGWLLCKKHPEVIVKGKNVDLSDLLEDPIVRFQRKYYILLVALFWGFLPTYIPVYYWGETVTNALCINAFRYTATSSNVFTFNINLKYKYAVGNNLYEVMSSFVILNIFM